MYFTDDASILSNLLAYREKNSDDQDMAVLKQVSPVACQHINLYGFYEFNKRSAGSMQDLIIT